MSYLLNFLRDASIGWMLGFILVWAYWVYDTQQIQDEYLELLPMQRNVWMQYVPHFYTQAIYSRIGLDSICVYNTTNYITCQRTTKPIYQDANGIPIDASVYLNIDDYEPRPSTYLEDHLPNHTI